MTALTIILADDHPLFRAALRTAVESAVTSAVVIEADSFSALQKVMGTTPSIDLVLLDLHMPGVQGFSSLLFLRAEHPQVPVIMVSADDSPLNVQRAQLFGASGFIPKSSTLLELTSAVRVVLEGGESFRHQTPYDSPEEQRIAKALASLTPAQLGVLLKLADGRLNKQIGFELGITEATVKAHVTAILRKLGLVGRTQAAVLAQRLIQSHAVPLSGIAPATGGAENE